MRGLLIFALFCTFTLFSTLSAQKLVSTNKADNPSPEAEYEKALLEKDARQRIRMLGNVIKLDTAYAQAYYSRGNAYDEIGDKSNALADFNKAIKIYPIFARAYNNRGLIHSYNKNYELAVKDFEKAIMLEDGFAEAYNNCGVAKKNMERYREAIVDFDQAIGIDSAYSTAYYNRAAAKQLTKDNEGALADYDFAIKYDDSDAYAPCAKGCLLVKLSRNAEAIKALKIGLKIDSELEWAKDCLEDALAKE